MCGFAFQRHPPPEEREEKAIHSIMQVASPGSGAAPQGGDCSLGHLPAPSFASVVLSSSRHEDLILPIKFQVSNGRDVSLLL